MAKKKTTDKKVKTVLFDPKQINKKAPDQTTEADKGKVILAKTEEAPKKPEEPKTPVKVKKTAKPKNKGGRPRKLNKTEYHNYALRIPENWMPDLFKTLQTNEMTGKQESINDFILRAIRVQIKKEKK